MLSELLSYFRAQARPEFRRLGYLRQSIALQARSRRLHSQWHEHQQQCRAVIEQAMAMVQGRNKVVVLGCGLLQELPIERLCREFAQVDLIDTIFLPVTRQLIQTYDNARLLEEDITGLTLPILLHRNSHSPLPKPDTSIPQLIAGADLVISANVLSQLPLIPLQYMVNRFDYSNEQLVDWGEAIIRDHLLALANADCHCVLITDTIHEERNRKGKILRREDMLFRVRLPDAAWQWYWPLVPMGEQSWRRETIAHMSAYSHFPYPYYEPE